MPASSLIHRISPDPYAPAPANGLSHGDSPEPCLSNGAERPGTVIGYIFAKIEYFPNHRKEDKIGFFGPPRLIPTFSVPDRDNPTDGRKDTRATLPSGKNPSGQPAPPIIIRPVITDRKHFLYRQARRLLPFPATHPSLCPYAVPIAFDTGGRPPANAVEDRQILYGQIRYYLCFYFIIPIFCHSPAINPAF